MVSATVHKRTNAFKKATERAKAQPQSSSTVTRRRVAKVPASAAASSAFIVAANTAAQHIHHTSRNIEKLRQAVRSSTMFNHLNKIDEINGLTHRVKEGIQDITRQLQVLAPLAQPKSKDEEEHAKNVVAVLNRRLLDCGNQFRRVLEEVAASQQDFDVKRKEFDGGIGGNKVGGAVPISLASQASQMSNEGPSLLYGDDKETVLEISAAPQMQSQMQLTQYDSRSRLEAAQGIEQGLEGVQQLIGKIAILVAEQGEQIERIDENIEGTLANVGSAQNQLLEYWRNINSNRSLITKILGVVALTIIMFFVMFI